MTMPLLLRKKLALSRRKLVLYAGSILTASAPGKLLAQITRSEAGGSGMPFCAVRPEQTEGPYFVDERLLRADIRSDPGDGTIREGLPLRLTLRLSTLADNVCSPLAGAVVDVWHNDAMGEYSDVRDRQYDNRGKHFLRGYQISDASGMVRFDTIYPGWYPGRTVHIHFKIRTDPDDNRGFEFTSQLYFDDAITDRVHSALPYKDNGQRSTRNRNDRIYRRGGDELRLQLVETGNGYEASFELGLEIA